MKKKRLRIERFVFVIICIVFIAFALTNILARPDPYKVYKEVASENKTIGEHNEQIEEISETKYHFLHYPVLEQENANTIIQEMINELPDVEGITFLDYESYEVADHYQSVLFHYQHLNAEQEVQESYDRGFTFDAKSGEQLALTDIMRRNYTDLIQDAFQKQANITLKDMENVQFFLQENDIVFTAENQTVKLPYADITEYLRIPQKGIANEVLEIKRTVEIDPDKPMIALTFDDGPSPYTDAFMDVFEQYQATASFFVLGSNVENYPDTIKRMIENGFEICNHSWGHLNIASDDKALIVKEIFDTQDVIYRMTGHEPTRIRPPFGEHNELTNNVANGNNVRITLWNVDTEDWRNRDASVTLERAKAGAFDGAIILFHDLYPTSLEAIKQLVPYLQSQGYQLVTVSDLFRYKADKTGL